MMSRRGRILLGVCAVGLVAATSAWVGTSIQITVSATPESAHAAEAEGPLVTPSPSATPTATPTVEVVPAPEPVVIESPMGEDPASTPTEEGPADEVVTEWHAMDEGPLICGPNAKPALDFNESTGWGWWAYCEPALVPSEEGPLMGYLPDCPTEDSDNCIWRADERGNGQGQSFIAYDGEVYYLP